MDQYASSPGGSTCCYTELALSTFSIIAHHLLDFMVHGKNRGRCTNNPSGRHPIRTVAAPPPSSPIFILSAISAATLTICPGLGQALNNAGLHTQWIAYIATRK